MLLVDIIKHKSSLLKSSTSLANTTAKLFFLQTCSDNHILPNGFGLKFSQQTGLPPNLAVQSDSLVKNILLDASFRILNATLQAERLKADLLHKKNLGHF